MSSAVRQPMTVDASLAWEAREPLRFEFDGIAPLAMTGATLQHNMTVGNIYAGLRARLAGTPCRASPRR